jgi:hypothetical protein
VRDRPDRQPEDRQRRDGRDRHAPGRARAEGFRGLGRPSRTALVVLRNPVRWWIALRARRATYTVTAMVASRPTARSGHSAALVSRPAAAVFPREPR